MRLQLKGCVLVGKIIERRSDDDDDDDDDD